MDGLTIQEAAGVTGWSPRMLRYVESAGLVEPDRSVSGYRLYGPGHLQRLRTLRELLTSYEVSLSDVGFARRLRTDVLLSAAVDRWLTAEPARPTHVDASDWLAFEQDKHQRLLSGPAATKEIA
jgi:DNA-binding transcriptional MerR regulator